MFINHVLNGKLSLLSVVMCWWGKREKNSLKAVILNPPHTLDSPGDLGKCHPPPRDLRDVPQGELTDTRTLFRIRHSHLAAEVGIIVPLHR